MKDIFKTKRIISMILVFCTMVTMFPLLETDAEAGYNYPKRDSEYYRGTELEFKPLWPLKSIWCRAFDHYSGGDMHGGIDFAAKLGTSVFSVYDGTVIETQNKCTHDDNGDETHGSGNKCANGGGSYGNYIKVKHVVNGHTYYTVYAHLKHDSLTVKKGDKVTAGQKIGESASTGDSSGPHLHFEVQDEKIIKEQDRDTRKGLRGETFKYYLCNPQMLVGIIINEHIKRSSTYFGETVSKYFTVGKAIPQSEVDAFIGATDSAPGKEKNDSDAGDPVVDIWEGLNGTKLTNGEEFISFLSKHQSVRFSNDLDSQRFAEEAISNCFGVSGNSKIKTAAEAKAKYLKSTSKDNVPIGATVYFDNNKENGFVGIYAGNNEVIYLSAIMVNAIRYEGYIQKDTIENIEKNLKYSYLGWGWQANYEITQPSVPESSENETAPVMTAETAVQKRILELLKEYPDGSKWKQTYAGAKQCYGFAVMIINKIFGPPTQKGKNFRKWTYNGTSNSGMVAVASTTKFTAESMKSFLSDARPGDVIQFSKPKQHAIVIYSVNENDVTVYESNVPNYTTRFRTVSFDHWENRNSTKVTLLRSDNYDSFGAVEQEEEITAPTIYKEDISFPQTLKRGENAKVNAKISCDVGLVSLVNVKITDSKGNIVQEISEYPEIKQYEIKLSTKMESLDFSKLPAGNYTIKVTATATNKKRVTTDTVYSGNLVVRDSEEKAKEENQKQEEESGAPVVTISDVGIPTHLEEGDGCSIYGEIKTDKGNLTKVLVVVYDSNEKSVLAESASPNKSTYSLWNSQIDKKLTFGKLTAGTYRLAIYATAEYKQNKTDGLLFSGNFEVKKSEKTPTLTLINASVPTTLTQGKGFPLAGKISTDCGKITMVVVTIFDSNGNTVLQEEANPNAKSFEILNSSIDNNLKFGSLTEGTYKIDIFAIAVNNGKQASESLLQRTFTVKKAETNAGNQQQNTNNNSSKLVNTRIPLRNISQGDFANDMISPQFVFGSYVGNGYYVDFYDGSYTITLGMHTLTGSYYISDSDNMNLKMTQIGYDLSDCINDYEILFGKVQFTDGLGISLTIYIRERETRLEDAYRLAFWDYEL